MYSIKNRNNLRLAFLLMVISAIFPLASPAQAVDWTISTIDGTEDVVVLSNSLAVDSNNKVHIGYIDSDGTNRTLKYVTNASGEWIISTIDSGDVGWHASIAVDSSNKVHISYYTATDHDLKYATNASGDWVTSTIDSGDKGLDASIAIDSNNKVHISYLAGTAGTLKYATNVSGHWVTSTIDSKKGVGFNTSIALDSNNKVHISYCDSINISLKYATNAKGHWVKSTIDSTDGVGSTSIAVDSDNKVHISYYDYGRYLKYATNASGHWITSTIDDTGDVGQFSSIAVDSDNKVHISYYDPTNHDLKYAVNDPLKLLSPNGGEVISAGSTYSIAWSAPSEALNFRLMYSVNNGKTWKRVHSAPYVIGLSYDWTVPALSNSKNKSLVKITGFDIDGKKLETDMSDATFTIGL